MHGLFVFLLVLLRFLSGDGTTPMEFSKAGLKCRFINLSED